MWITAAISAASLGTVIWVIAARRTARKRGERLRDTLRRQWRKAKSDVPDVTSSDVRRASSLLVAADLDRHGDSGGGWDDSGGSGSGGDAGGSD
jgi:hypothetical protein